MKISIEYGDTLPIDSVCSKIIRMDSPQILIWYIGVNGLKQNGSEFYKNFLFSPIVKAGNQPVFWMLDLTAWKALVTQKVHINKNSKIAEKINFLQSRHFNCIHSSGIFKRMKNLSDDSVVSHFKNSLKKEFIWESSKHVPNSDISIGEAFENNCPIFSDWYHVDTNKFYSVLQYVEGFLLIEEIVLNAIKNKILDKDLKIVFVIPNDEIKYYFDEDNSFEKDVIFFLSHYHGDRLKGMNIQVSMLSFTYGKEKHHRPYNSPGATLKSSKVLLEEILPNF